MIMTPHQIRAVETTNQSVALVASAGSGKTRVLVERVKHLVQKNQCPISRILLFTFTEKAASEIKERILKEEIINPLDEALLSVGTIHSFLAGLLRLFGTRININPNFTIHNAIHEQMNREIFCENFLMEKLKSSDLVLSYWIDRYGFLKIHRLIINLLKQPKIHLYTEEGLKNPDSPQGLMALAHELHQHEIQNKLEKSILHFDDLEYLALRLLRTNPDIRQTVIERYQHILVDEFQDTSPLQGALIKTLHEPGKNILFFVGDPYQSIYRFRHANLSIFKDALRDIHLEGGLFLTLPETFRLSPKITALVNRVFTVLFNEESPLDIQQSLPKPTPLLSYTPMIPFFKDKEGSVDLVIAPGSPHDIHSLRSAEARWIARDILSLNLDSNELDQTALLFRSGAPLLIYKRALDKAGIPCVLSHAENLLAKPEIRDLIHILNGLSGDLSLITQTGILRSSFFHFSEMFIENTIHQTSSQFLHHVVPNLFSTSDDKKKWELVTHFWRLWEVKKNLLLPSCLMREIILSLSKLDNSPLSEDFFSDAEHWCQILEDLELNDSSFTLKTSLVYQSVSEKIRRMMRDSSAIPSLPKTCNSTGVHLMTIHSAKGLEFKRVYLPQLYATVRSENSDYLFDNVKGLILKDLKSEGSGLKLRLEESPLFTEIKNKEEWEDRNEIKRLLYVAMTRGSHSLILFLKEPSKSKTHLQDMDHPNEWLYFLMEKERQNAKKLLGESPLGDSPFHEQDNDPSSIPWRPFEEKLNRAFDALDDKKPESNVFPALSIGRENDEKKISFPFKPTYAVSQIESYFRCPREFQLKYLCGIQGLNKVEPWEDLVHEVLFHDDFSSAMEREVLIDSVLRIKKIIDHDSVMKRSLMKMIEKLLEHNEVSPLLAQAKSSKKEVPFLFDYGSFYIKGTINLLIQHDDNLTLVDYKTDKISSQDELNERGKAYFGQMASLALVASRAFKRDVLKTALLFTDGPHLVMESWNASKIKVFEQSLSQMHSHWVQKEAFFPFTSQPKTCFHCRYYELNYCGVRSI